MSTSSNGVISRYKPGAIAKWLPSLNYLVYLDMDLVVKDPSVDFVKRFVGQVG